jgi:hypothetical protein
MNVSDNGRYHKSVRLFKEKDHDKPMMTLWKSVEPMANQGVLERKSCVAGVPNCDKHALVAAFNPSEKYEFVSWDDDYSEYMGKKMFQTTNQCKMKTLFLGPTANCAFHQVHFPVPSPPNTPQSCKIGPF